MWIVMQLSALLRVHILPVTFIENNHLNQDIYNALSKRNPQLRAAAAEVWREGEMLMCLLILTHKMSLQLAQINQPDSLKLTSDLAKALNREVLSGLELGADVEPGVVRRYSVVVDHHLGAPSEDCQYLLDRLCDWLSGEEFSAPSPDLKSSTPWSRPSSLTSTSPGYALSATATGARRDCWSLPSWSTRECRPPRPTC